MGAQQLRHAGSAPPPARASDGGVDAAADAHFCDRRENAPWATLHAVSGEGAAGGKSEATPPIVMRGIAPHSMGRSKACRTVVGNSARVSAHHAVFLRNLKGEVHQRIGSPRLR